MLILADILVFFLPPVPKSTNYRLNQRNVAEAFMLALSVKKFTTLGRTYLKFEEMRLIYDKLFIGHCPIMLKLSM